VLAGTRSDGFRQAASKIPGNALTFDVAAHGNANELILYFADGTGLSVSPQEAAQLVRALPGYQPGRPIRLIACDTGRLPDGFAHQLAQEMQVPIQAPNRWVWFDGDGGNLRVNGVIRRGTQFIENEADPGSWIWFGKEFWTNVR
jgi:hypothetical protein